MIDKLGATDSLQAGLSSYVSPVHPCKMCKKETKEDREEGWRICSAPNCRHRQQASDKEDSCNGESSS